MDKELVTSLQRLPEWCIKDGRRIGNTTRAIDHAIQLLFSGCKVFILDPWQNGRNENANKDMFRRTLDRIKREHTPLEIKFDSKALTIELIDSATPPTI